MSREPSSNVEPFNRRPGEPNGVGINGKALSRVFPFHIAFDADFTVIQVGRNLKKIYPDIVPGVRFTEWLDIISPAVTMTLDAIADQSYTVFVARSHRQTAAPERAADTPQSSPPDLRGQMVQIKSGDAPVLLFLCNPVISGMADVARLGLTLSDFATHDSMLDYLVLLQTEQATLDEQKGLAAHLQKEIAVRKEAEAALTLVNEELEERVRLRARELEDANTELRSKNLRLKGWSERLEERNRQILILNKMGDMLRACQTVEETYDVIRDSLGRLFPGLSGELALYSEIDHHYEVVSSWGGMSDIGRVFKFDDCWGLRLGHLHKHETDEPETRCAHIGHTEGDAYICVPMIVREKKVGLLHLEWTRPDKDSEFDATPADESRRHLAETAAEQIALSIANLVLQQSLLSQSIRDPLTGLYNRRHLEESVMVEVGRASRLRNSVSFILINVDNLKGVNDAYGHAVGDRLLRQLGELLRQNLRSLDIPCRLDGDEFLLILPGTRAEDGRRRAEDLRQKISATLQIPTGDDQIESVTISAGVSAFPLNGNDHDVVLRAADAALVAAKKDGRDQVVMAPLRGTPRDD